MKKNEATHSNGQRTNGQTTIPGELTAEHVGLTNEAGKADAAGQAAKKEDLRKQTRGLNLEATIQVVEDLHRKKVQRDNLAAVIDRLDNFEVKQKEVDDIDEDRYYSGCVLTITDDNRNSWNTRNTAIIKKVTEFVRALCEEKMADIEADIVLPQE